MRKPMIEVQVVPVGPSDMLFLALARTFKQGYAIPDADLSELRTHVLARIATAATDPNIPDEHREQFAIDLQLFVNLLDQYVPFHAALVDLYSAYVTKYGLRNSPPSTPSA